MILDKEVVVTIPADMQGELNAIWDKLLSAFGDESLPEDAASQEKVKEAIARLEAHPAKKARAAAS